MFCTLFSLFQNYHADNISLCLQPIISYWGIYYYSLNISSPRLLYFYFTLTTRLKDSVIDTNGYFDRSGSCIKILIDFNILIGLSYIFVSYCTFISIEFWSCLLQKYQMTLYDLLSFYWVLWLSWYSHWSLLDREYSEWSDWYSLYWDLSIGALFV